MVLRQAEESSRRQRLRAVCLMTAALLLPSAALGQEGAPGAASATFYTQPNFAGPSKTLTLPAGQPYQAIPFVGDELNEQIRSVKADPQIGVILFQRPYFASRDDACGPNLGTRENPRAWWQGLTADLVPPRALPSDQPYEAAETPDDDYSSVIAYRRESGPPPGFLLLERRSYYNRACERSDEQSYFNRLFVPVPNPPQREACIELSLPASSHGAGADAPRFTRLSEAVALLPESFDARYAGIDHRFVAALFTGAGCNGPSITLNSRERGAAARYKLKDFEFSGRVKSVLIRYQRGPLDKLMDAPAVAAAAPALVPSPSSPTAPSAAAPSAAAPSAADASSATAPAPAPSGSTASGSPSNGSAASSLRPQSAQPQPPAPETASGTQGDAGGLQPQPPAPSGAQSGGLQPAPPTAPAQQQQALQPAPQVQPVPVQPAVTPAPRGPVVPQEETFRFPVHQVYRLNFCVDNDQGCGDPAANAWCKAKGFSTAARWAREDNIGALYPTVFIGNGSICDKFLCDGFEEITCTR